MAQGTVTVSPSLLLAVKVHLDQTWEDPLGDQKLTELIASGMVYLDGKLGVPGDYESYGTPRTLLFEYVRYARDGAMDIFEQNYLHLLLTMQSERQLKDHAQTETGPA